MVAERVINQYYNSDFEYAVGFAHKLLNIAILWPDIRQKSFVIRAVTLIFHLAACVLVITFLIPMILQVVCLENSVPDMVNCWGLILCFFIGWIKFLVFLFQQRNISMCLEQMRTDWQEIDKDGRQHMLKNVKNARKYALSSTGIMFFCLFSWHAKQISLGSFIINNKTAYSLTYKVYFVTFNPYYPPEYFYVLALQMLGSFFCVTCMMNTFSLAVVVIMHVCGQFEILNSAFMTSCERQLRSGDKVEYSIKGLPQLVRKHHHLLRFSALVDKTFDGIFFTEWINCVNGVCLCGYLFIVDYRFNDKVNDLLGMLDMSLMFFLLCHIGEQFKQKCENIGHSLYSSKWYRLKNTDFRKCIMTVQISQHPYQLTAGKIINLSMETFCEVMKRAFTFMSLLRSLT